MQALSTTLLWIAAQSGGAVAGDLRLPEGPVARAWAGVGEGTQPVELERAFAEEAGWLLAPRSPDPAALPAPATWEAWAAWLATSREPGDDDAPRARAGLALVALRQERWQDAWAHLAELGGHPEWMAALMPHLLPGAPLATPATPGGHAAALPDGVLLVPAPPPPATEGPMGPPRVRGALAGALQIGAARVELELTVEPAGVQVDLRHVGGGPVELRVLMPEPRGQEIRVEYLDWMRQDEVRRPLPVRLEPGAEPVTLFARTLPRRSLLPALPAGEPPRALVEGGLWLELAPGVAESDELRSAAAALGRALGVPAGLRRPLDPPAREPWSGTVVHLAAGDDLARRLLELASAVEAYLLASERPR